MGGFDSSVTFRTFSDNALDLAVDMKLNLQAGLESFPRRESLI